MFENPNCTACELHTGTKRVCMPGSGSLSVGARLLVLLDHPNRIEERMNRPMAGAGTQLVRWMFARMGLQPTDYYLEYVVKCCPPDGTMPNNKARRLDSIKACAQYRHMTMQMGAFPVVVGLGRLACEALVGSQEIGKFSDTFWPSTDPIVAAQTPVVWIGPNVNAILMNPGQAGELYRVLWAAALQANYTPTLTKVEPFDWSDFIK